MKMPPSKTRNQKYKQGPYIKRFGTGAKDIDFTRFRDDIDIKKSIDSINCAILGLAEQKRNRVSSFADVGIEVLDEFDEYFKILERCFYKEGER